MRTSMILSILLVIFLIGCSNAEKSPIEPEKACLPSIENPSDIQILASGIINLDDETVELSNRDISYYLDVTSIVGSNFSFTIDTVHPPHVLEITLRLNNSSSLTVYDVCIVFDELYGKTVDNPDSYIDIFDPGDIDPFIAFKKENQNRDFAPGTDTEKLFLVYPSGTSPLVDFFIIAHLNTNTGGVYNISDWQVNGQLTTNGGNAIASLRIQDHQNDVSLVGAETSAISGGITLFHQTANPEIWEGTIYHTRNLPSGQYQIIVMGTSPATPGYNTYNYFDIYIAPVTLQPTVFGNDFKIADSSVFRDPDMFSAGHHAMAADGNNFYLTFYDWGDYDQGAVYFTKSTDGGVTWDAATPVTDESDAYKELNPVIALGNQSIYIVYHSNAGAPFKIMLSKSVDQGLSWTEYDFTNDLPGGHDEASVSVDTNSSPEIVYTSFVSYDTGDKIYVARSPGDDLINWSFVVISDTLSTSNEDMRYPSIAYNLISDMVMVCWSDSTATSDDGNRLYFDKSTDGYNWGVDTLVTDVWESRDREWESSLAINPSTGVPGILYRHWSFSLPGTEIRFVRASDNRGDNFLPTRQVFQMALLSYTWGCSLQCESSGRWLGAWFSFPNNLKKYNCYFSESLNDGFDWEDRVQINDPDNPITYNPAIASNGSDVCIAWTDERYYDEWVFVNHGIHD